MDDQTLHHFMEDLSPILIGITLIIAAAWVITGIVKAFNQKSILQTRAELYNRLLDKFGSANEFAEYLESDTGRQFVEEITVRSAPPTNKILNSIQRGVILVLAGLGLLVLGNLFDNSLGGDLYIVLVVGGTTGLMLGIGFLISTAITYYLSKSWGLLAVEEKPKEAKRAAGDQSSEQ